MEEKGKSQPKERKHRRRKVSLFKRRKKPEIRAFVIEKKNLAAKRFFKTALLFALGLIALGMFLLVAKIAISELLFSRNGKTIFNPQLSTVTPREKILKDLGKQPFTVSEINFSSNSAVVKFTANNEATVYLSQEKNIDEQLKILDAILRELASSKKQTILVDLRYNKPIVKFK